MVTSRLRLAFVAGCASGLIIVVGACGRTLSDDEGPRASRADAGGSDDGNDAPVVVPDAAEVDAGIEIVCPDGMVRATSFCIDAHEVSVAEYEALLDENDAGVFDAGALDAGARCAWKSELTRVSGQVPEHPVRAVDWCDAVIYCQAVGKRLCGSVDPSAPPVKNAASGQWFIACSQSGAQVYPYGDVFDQARCNTKSGAVAPVDRDSGCSGGYPGLVDMSGNVREWEDSCDQGGKEADRRCLTRGGSHAHDKPNELSCTAAIENARKEAPPDVGFRCCWP